MENDNNKMTDLTCGKTYRPDNTACLDCGKNAETLEQYGRCRKLWIMTIEKAHQVLKNIGLDVESRNCLAQNEQLIYVAELAESGGGLKLDNDIINRLAKENRLNKKEILERYNIFEGVYEEYISDIRFVVWKKIKRKKRARERRRRITGKFILCDRKLSANEKLSLKGKCIGKILKRCHYLLSHAQLEPLIKNFELTGKNIAELCDLGVIYRKANDNTYLYAESEMKFKQKWGNQVEYFNELFNRSDFTKTNRLISYLVESALLEKGWRLDEIYVSILIGKVLQIPMNMH